MKTLTLINGNGQKIQKTLPTLKIIGHFNKVALNHIKENTGLDFRPTYRGYEAQPNNSAQITKLFLTYNFKTRYYDNADYHNTLFLKSDHHIGFDVDSICRECCRVNNINTNGLDRDDRLAC